MNMAVGSSAVENYSYSKSRFRLRSTRHLCKI